MVAWLEREGLGALSSIAREQGFDGGILLALYDVRMDAPTYKSDCNDLGIPAGAIQIKLKGRLVALFGLRLFLFLVFVLKNFLYDSSSLFLFSFISFHTTC